MSALLYKAVAVMNMLLDKDADAISKLCALHVAANREVCLCRPTHTARHDEFPVIRLLGTLEVVNAICATDTLYVVPIINAVGVISGFEIAGRKRPKNLSI